MLRRLVVETERMFTEPLSGADEPATTVPMEGHGLGEFHIRMGMLAEADKVYRKILEKDRHDERARLILGDLVSLRRALGDEADPVPARSSRRCTGSRRRGPARAAAWGTPTDPADRYPRIGAQDEPDEPTDVLAAADEAELLLKLGKADQALAMYRLLAIRHPKRAAFQRRIEEIEALAAERAGPMAEAVTARHDMSALLAQAVPTNPRIEVADLARLYPPIGDFDDDEPTATTVDVFGRREDE
ncbi:MAG: hypothetical protein H6719_05540 [Sandaracinaceae bacterium]|nr:hypothetical protein [Sandaracinaceae bacterium]